MRYVRGPPSPPRYGASICITPQHIQLSTRTGKSACCIPSGGGGEVKVLQRGKLAGRPAPTVAAALLYAGWTQYVLLRSVNTEYGYQ